MPKITISELFESYSESVVKIQTFFAFIGYIVTNLHLWRKYIQKPHTNEKNHFIPSYGAHGHGIPGSERTEHSFPDAQEDH